MEGEILHVVRQAHHSDDQLDEWVHQQSQVADLCIGEGQDPELETIVELPRVDILERIFSLQIKKKSCVREWMRLLSLTKELRMLRRCKHSCLMYWKPS